MTLRFNPKAELAEDALVYICDGCKKERSYLSESWSEITVFGLVDGELVHLCLECRSIKIIDERPTLEPQRIQED